MKEKLPQNENWKIHQPSAKEELSKEDLLMGSGRVQRRSVNGNRPGVFVWGWSLKPGSAPGFWASPVG